MLLRANADVHRVSAWSETALSNAVKSGKSGIVEALLCANADPNVRAGENGSPLALAAACGHASVVESLIKHQADVNKVNEDANQRVPLMYASMAKRGHTAMRTLVAGKANVNATDEFNHTALSLAVVLQHTHAVRELLHLNAVVLYPTSVEAPPSSYPAALRGSHPPSRAQVCLLDTAWRVDAVEELHLLCSDSAAMQWTDADGCHALMRFCREPLRNVTRDYEYTPVHADYSDADSCDGHDSDSDASVAGEVFGAVGGDSVYADEDDSEEDSEVGVSEDVDALEDHEDERAFLTDMSPCAAQLRGLSAATEVAQLLTLLENWRLHCQNSGASASTSPIKIL